LRKARIQEFDTSLLGILMIEKKQLNSVKLCRCLTRSINRKINKLYVEEKTEKRQEEKKGRERKVNKKERNEGGKCLMQQYKAL